MKKTLKIISLFLLSILTQFAFAKSLNLYDQPAINAKVIGTVESENGVIPIFSSKDNNWVKVGDPRNGNVGWIKSSELSGVNSTGITFRVITTGTGPQSYRIVQFGTPSQITPEQAQAMVKQIQMQQQTLQTDIQKMMQDMFNQQKTIFPEMPGIVMPQQPATNAPAAVKPNAAPTTPAQQR